MIDISLEGTQVQVGHGRTPTGEKVMQLKFLDPASGITVSATWVGEGLEAFKRDVNSGIQIAGTVPPHSGQQNGS